MFWTIIDVTITVLVAIAAWRMAYLGLHPPDELSKTKYRTEFKCWGVLLVLLAIWQGVRQQITQQAWTKILTGLSTDVKGLKDKPPVVEVNVPPALNPPPVKQRATMGIPDYNGVKFDYNPQSGWWVNLLCQNMGTSAVAKNVVCTTSTEKVPAINRAPTKQTLQGVWMRFSKLVTHPAPSVDLEPGKGIWGSFGLDMHDIDPALISGDKVIVLAGTISYSDDLGRHRKEYCRWSQPPFVPDNTVWHLCEIGHNREVY